MIIKNNLKGDLKIESNNESNNNLKTHQKNHVKTIIIGAGTTGKSILLFFVKLMYYWNESFGDKCSNDVVAITEVTRAKSRDQEFNKYDFYYYLVDFLKNYDRSSAFYDDFCEYTDDHMHNHTRYKSEMDWLYKVLRQIVNGRVVIIDDGMTSEKVEDILSYIDDKYKVENVLSKLEFVSSQDYMKEMFCDKSYKKCDVDLKKDNCLEKGLGLEGICDLENLHDAKNVSCLESLNYIESVNRVFLSPGVKMIHPLVEKFLNFSSETVQSDEVAENAQNSESFKASKTGKSTEGEIFSNDIDLFLRVVQLQKKFFLKRKNDLQNDMCADTCSDVQSDMPTHVSSDMSKDLNQSSNKDLKYSGEFLLIGVTGSNGKSTTVSLISHMFNEHLIKCGNIGVGVFDALELMNEKMYKILSEIDGLAEFDKFYEFDDFNASESFDVFDTNRFLGYVVEISSAQLINVSCAHLLDYGFLLNITPNHLDYHKDLNDYANMKFKILNAENSFISSDAEINRKEIKRILGNLSNENVYSEDGLNKGILRCRHVDELRLFGLFSIESCISSCSSNSSLSEAEFSGSGLLRNSRSDTEFYNCGDYDFMKKYCFLNGEIFLNGNRVLSLKSKKQYKKDDEAVGHEEDCDDNYTSSFNVVNSESDGLMYRNYVPEYAVLISFILINSILEKFGYHDNFGCYINFGANNDLQNGVSQNSCKIGKNFIMNFVVNFVSKLNSFIGLKYRLEKILSISGDVICRCDADLRDGRLKSGAECVDDLSPVKGKVESEIDVSGFRELNDYDELHDCGELNNSGSANNTRKSNVTFFNDSKSTTVISTIFALKHLRKMNRNARIFLILGGGNAKKQNFHELKEVEDILSDVRNKFFIVGEARNRIANALKDVSGICDFRLCEDMYEAVNEICDFLYYELGKDNNFENDNLNGKKLNPDLNDGLRESLREVSFRSVGFMDLSRKNINAKGANLRIGENLTENNGENFSKTNENFVILSPGCESFDQYKNFNQRGERFTEYVLSKFEKILDLKGFES